MVFNANISNISVISWKSFLLVEETRISGENHRPEYNTLVPIILIIPKHLYLKKKAGLGYDF